MRTSLVKNTTNHYLSHTAGSLDCATFLSRKNNLIVPGMEMDTAISTYSFWRYLLICLETQTSFQLILIETKNNNDVNEYQISRLP